MKTILNFQTFNESHESEKWYYISMYDKKDDAVCYGEPHHRGKHSAEEFVEISKKNGCENVKIHTTVQAAKNAADKLLKKYKKDKAERF